MSVRIVVISDTHGMHNQVTIPEGDILIHAGDLTSAGTLLQLEAFSKFMGGLPHRHKIVIAGNHDLCLERQPEASKERLFNVTYLQDELITVGGVTIYGSPWQPWFFDWAFNLQRGPEIKAMWDLIPSDVDILITHGPPIGLGDRTEAGERVGCEELRAAVDRVRPRLHVYGHIHEGYGVRRQGETLSVNASLCDVNLQLVNKPLVFDFEGSEVVQVNGE